MLARVSLSAACRAVGSRGKTNPEKIRRGLARLGLRMTRVRVDPERIPMNGLAMVARRGWLHCLAIVSGRLLDPDFRRDRKAIIRRIYRVDPDFRKRTRAPIRQ